MGREGDVGEVRRSAHVDVLLAALHGAPGADDVVLQLRPEDEIFLENIQNIFLTNLAHTLSGAEVRLSSTLLRLQLACWR